MKIGELVICMIMGLLVFGLGYSFRIAVYEGDLAVKYQTYREVYQGTLEYDLWKRIYTYNRNSLDNKL